METRRYQPVVFRGTEYPAHFVIKASEDEDLQNGTIIGFARAIPSCFEDRDTQSDQILIWDQGSIIAISENAL